MTAVSTMVILQHDSGLPEDRTINTWSAEVDSASLLTGIADWHIALNTFYQGIDGFLSSLLSGAGEIRSYRRSDPEPRVPLVITPILITPGTTTLPSEVALCMSFQGGQVAGVPQSRRRGRVYIGPIQDAAAVNTTGRPTSSLISGLAANGDALMAASDAAANWTWTVWSPTDGANVPITNGWVDNSWDTQRRRGIASNARTTWS